MYCYTSSVTALSLLHFFPRIDTDILASVFSKPTACMPPLVLVVAIHAKHRTDMMLLAVQSIIIERWQKMSA